MDADLDFDSSLPKLPWGRKMTEQHHVSHHKLTEHAVVLPCEPSEFREFISSLLGRPQKIIRRIYGFFEISKEDIVNIFHLIDQRIESQNESSLISAVIRIDYNDNSSVELNSLNDFINYAEIKHLATEALYLSVIYLIKFKNRPPEKQEIEIFFKKNNDSGSEMSVDSRGIHFDRTIREGITVRINHTDRTWGTDIDSLLNENLTMLINNDSGIRKLASDNCGTIGFAFASTFIFASLFSVYRVTANIIDDYLVRAKSISDSTLQTTADVSKKIDFIIEIIASGMWTKYAFYTTGFLIASIIVSIFLGIIMSEVVSSKNENLFLLTKRDDDRKKIVAKRISGNWLSLTSSVIGALVIGVAGNYIFSKLTQWFQI